MKTALAALTAIALLAVPAVASSRLDAYFALFPNGVVHTSNGGGGGGSGVPGSLKLPGNAKVTGSGVVTVNGVQIYP